MNIEKIMDSMSNEVMNNHKKFCEEQTEKSAKSIAHIALSELQFRKIIIGKAICMDNLSEWIYKKARQYGIKPFVNLVIRNPKDIPPDINLEPLYEIKAGSQTRNFAVWFDWGVNVDGKREGHDLPAFVSYAYLPIKDNGAMYKLIDIDLDNLRGVIDNNEIVFLEAVLNNMSNANLNNRLIYKDQVRELYESIQNIGIVLKETYSDMDVKRVYYTGGGFQIWGKYDYEVLKPLICEKKLCKSNANPYQLQRLSSTNLIKHSPHFQTCIDTEATFSEFRYSNPAFFQLPHNPELYEDIEAFMDTFYFTKYSGCDNIADSMFNDRIKKAERIRKWLGQ